MDILLSTLKVNDFSKYMRMRSAGTGDTKLPIARLKFCLQIFSLMKKQYKDLVFQLILEGKLGK